MDLLPVDKKGCARVRTNFFETLVYSEAGNASRYVAEEIVKLVSANNDAGRATVLGLATGATPRRLYRSLVHFFESGAVSFANVTTFNLDEYCGLGPDDPNSYRRYMRENLVDHIDIDPARVHFPDPNDPGAFDDAIRAAGGIDVQILGIGRTGHIGFNEPGSHPESVTRVIHLAELTRADAAGDFGGCVNAVPRRAVTMGVGTVARASRIFLLAFGSKKAGIVARAAEAERTSACPASLLQVHGGVTLVLEAHAAAKLTCVREPWTSDAGFEPLRTSAGDDEGAGRSDAMNTANGVLAPSPIYQVQRLGRGGAPALPHRDLSRDGGFGSRACWPEWSHAATLWLARRCGRGVARLTADDFVREGLDWVLNLVRSDACRPRMSNVEAVRVAVQASLNRVAEALRRDIVPGAVPGAGGGACGGPGRALIFSPHPDDDVISCGAAIGRMTDAGCDVHVAYQTTGSHAVPDAAIWNHLRFALETCGGGQASPVGGVSRSEVEAWCDAVDAAALAGDAPPQSPDPPGWVRALRARVREVEAVAGARAVGVPRGNLHFMRLPFYDSHGKGYGDDDVSRVAALISTLRPSRIFVAGDLSDPHGTHESCFRILRKAVRMVHCASTSKNSPDGDDAWPNAMDVALYRGGWASWSVREIDIAVTLDAVDVARRRRAILAHASQRDGAMFLGEDGREFFQRVEDDGRSLAADYVALGFPDYEAVEGFVVVPSGKWISEQD